MLMGRKSARAALSRMITGIVSLCITANVSEIYLKYTYYKPVVRQFRVVVTQWERLHLDSEDVGSNRGTYDFYF